MNSTFPYPERPGTSAIDPSDLSNLSFVQSSENIEAIIGFEHGLYGLALDPSAFPQAYQYQLQKAEDGTPLESLEIIWQKKVNTTNLGVSFFLTEKGKTELAQKLGLRIGEGTTEDCAQALARIDIDQVPSSVLDELEADSVGYEEEQITQRFVDGGFNGSAVAAPNIVTLYKNPEVIIEKARGYRQLKNYINKVKSDLTTSGDYRDDEVLRAQLAYVDLYRHRVNVLLSSVYIEGYKLLSQYRTSGESAHAQVVDDLEEILPAFFKSQSNPFIAHFLQRMDRYQHGVVRDNDGSFTWLSSQARDLSSRVDQASNNDRTIDRGVFSDIDPDTLDSTELAGETLGSLISDVLNEYGLLSEHTDWNSEREGRAKDGKWQVVVNDKFKSLSVNNKQGVVKVPTKIMTLTAAITLANHEITHVLQHVNKGLLGDIAILERIGFDDASEQTESGGKWQERVAREALTGKIDYDIPGTSYLKALLVKERGGTFGECLNAYYQDLQGRNPGKDPQKIAAQAVNRTRRIFRSGGFEFAQDTTYLTNTQPLNYLEQQLIYESLNDEQKRLLFIGGITVNNVRALSRHGLVDMDNIFIPQKMPWELMKPAVRAIIDATKPS